VIRLGKGQLCLNITLFSLGLELGNALCVREGRYREQTENSAKQQDMRPGSVCRIPCFHAQQLTLEFVALPDRLSLTGVAVEKLFSGNFNSKIRL
jgi:hypothetical protein